MPADSKSAAPHDFVVTREFDAPRELVWQMWTNPKYLVHRVAPPGFTATVREAAVSTGGTFCVAMRSSEGAEFFIVGHYLEVIPLERLVYALARSQTPRPDPSAPEVFQTVTFDDLPGKTRVTVSLRFDSAPDRDAMLQSGGDNAMASSLDRVADLLAEVQKASDAHKK